MISENHYKKSETLLSSFSPCLTKTLDIQRDPRYFVGSAKVFIYSEKHDLIIASPSDQFVHFFNAGTLEPVKGRNKLELKSTVMFMSFCPQTNVYLFACEEKEIYAYDASSKKLKQLKSSASSVSDLVFISPVYYVLATSGPNGIQLRSLDDDSFVKTRRQNYHSYSLYALKNQKVLLSGVVDGDVIVYRTDKLPKLPKICSVRTQKMTSGLTKVEGARIKQKEFIITCEFGERIQIWHLLKGRMRKVRALTNPKKNYDFTYLEEYKMIAVVNRGSPSGSVKFISLMSGKVVFSVNLGEEFVSHIFVMKDRNAIGVTNSDVTTVKIVQLV